MCFQMDFIAFHFLVFRSSAVHLLFLSIFIPSCAVFRLSFLLLLLFCYVDQVESQEPGIDVTMLRLRSYLIFFLVFSFIIVGGFISFAVLLMIWSFIPLMG